MEKMPETPSPGEKLMSTIEIGKQRGIRLAMDNMWLIVTLLALAVIVTVMTTDISMESVSHLTSIGQEFFVLLFCTYIVYLSWGGNGTRQGMLTQAYKDACTRYGEIRDKIVAAGLQTRLAAFCQSRVEEELKSVRLNIICSCGLDYDTYEQFVGKSEDKIRESGALLTEAQIKAILRANKVNPIRLTPGMLLQREKISLSRAVIGTDPATVRMITNVWRLVSNAVVTFLVTITAFDVSASFDWSVVGEVLFKLVTVLYGGFCGYQTSYENITVRAVRHINTQADLLEQFYNGAEK